MTINDYICRLLILNISACFANCPLPVARCPLPTYRWMTPEWLLNISANCSFYVLPTAHCQLPTYRWMTTEWLLNISANCSFQACQLPIANCQLIDEWPQNGCWIFLPTVAFRLANCSRRRRDQLSMTIKYPPHFYISQLPGGPSEAVPVYDSR